MGAGFSTALAGMGGPYVLVAGLLLTCGSMVVSKLAEHDEYWYDFWHDYHEIHQQYTDAIDTILTDADMAIMSTTRYVDGRKVPGLGVHYYFPMSKKESSWFAPYIGLIKVRQTIDSKTIEYYRVFIRSADMEYYDKFLQTVSGEGPDSISAMHIDASEHQCAVKTVMLRFQGEARMPQQIILDHIKGRYEKTQNVKILIEGARGTGKSHIGKLVKKWLGIHAQFYHNFDPTQIGVDIQTMVLSKAKKNNPVVLVIDDVHRIFPDVHREKMDCDSRVQHSRNEATFQKMLDAIENTKYVVCIFTSEIAANELYKIEDNRSFMREGRIDSFARITDTTAEILNSANVKQV